MTAKRIGLIVIVLLLIIGSFLLGRCSATQPGGPVTLATALPQTTQKPSAPTKPGATPAPAGPAWKYYLIGLTISPPENGWQNVVAELAVENVGTRADMAGYPSDRGKWDSWSLTTDEGYKADLDSGILRLQRVSTWIAPGVRVRSYLHESSQNGSFLTFRIPVNSHNVRLSIGSQSLVLSQENVQTIQFPTEKDKPTWATPGQPVKLGGCLQAVVKDVERREEHLALRIEWKNLIQIADSDLPPRFSMVGDDGIVQDQENYASHDEFCKGKIEYLKQLGPSQTGETYHCWRLSQTVHRVRLMIIGGGLDRGWDSKEPNSAVVILP